jgi:hypothetical protein
VPYDYIRYFLDWLARPEEDHVLCVVTSTQPASGDVPQDQRHGIVSYAAGYLNGREYGIGGAIDQYFSDRRTAGHPFDPANVDRLGVEISADPNTREVSVELVAISWGGGRQALTGLHMVGGVLVGEGSSVGGLAPGALYAVSLGTWAFA